VRARRAAALAYGVPVAATSTGAPRGRVLMVVRPSKGGAFGHALRLSRELQARGYECAICGPHGHLAGSVDVPIAHVEIPRRPHPARHPAAIARVGAVYRRFRPHVVHAHGSQGGVVARLARLARPRTPVVFTPHNFAFTNYFTSRAERGLYRGIEVSLAPLASRVLCVCEAERRVAEGVGSSSRIRVVYNGIEPLAPAPASPEIAAIAAVGPLIGVVAELQPPKGVTTAVAAMPAILRRFPTASLVVAGDGGERAALESEIAALGVGGSVRLLGSVDGVAGLLGAADVCVQPGWSESFPYSVLEAMSLARPIVATDVGGVGEAVEDGVTGRLVPPQDPGALAAAAIDLMADRQRATALGAAARERMMSRFRLDQMVEGTLAAYREVGLP
jgi:glycosyltransferase involved in cell wall biosynthesis